MSKKLTTSTNDVLDTDLIAIDESTIELGSNVYIDGDLDVMGGLLKNGYQLFNDTIQRIDINGNDTIRISDDVKIQQYAVYNANNGELRLVFDRPVLYINTNKSFVTGYDTGFGVDKNETSITIMFSNNVQAVSIVYCFGLVFIGNLFESL